jgi:hypothetical protein
LLQGVNKGTLEVKQIGFILDNASGSVDADGVLSS